MDADLLKFLLTALGSGGLVAALLRVIGPALRLNQASNDASRRAIEQWTTLYNEQKQETAQALAALHEAEEQLREAQAQLAAALARIRQLEEKQALP
jgi:septal ring factor EnvC (AmiA/AmiB activator)